MSMETDQKYLISNKKGLLIIFGLVLVCLSNSLAVTDCPQKCKCPADKNFTVDCSGSLLTTLPDTAKETVSLSISHNALGPIINASFPRMSGLADLDLSYNGLRRLLGCTLQGMLELKYLNLRGNRLMSLPDGLFEDSNNLEHLDVSHNILVGLPDHVFRNLPQLKRLDLSHNRMVKLKFGLGLQVPRHIEMIDLSHNHFENLTSDSFEMASGWEPGFKRTLSLSNCRLSSVQSPAFDKITGLNDLDLSRNPNLPFHNLTSLVKELETKGLERLSISGLNITNLAPLLTQVTTLPLKYLNVSDNLIENVPASTFSTVSSIRILDLSGNKLSSLDAGFSDLRNVKVLNLSSNRLTSFKGDAVSNLNNLEVLDVSDNVLTAPAEVTFTPLTKLTSLDVSNNLLTSVILPESTDNLKHVDYHSNGIIHFSGFNSAPKLEYFDISDNDLEKIREYLFKEARFLKFVNFSKNSIKELDHRAFLPQSPLVIDISHNFLIKLQFSNWVATQELYLNHNEITDLDIQTFHRMNGLRVLDLSNNKISHLNEDLLDYTTSLTHLNLSRNSIGQTYFFQLFRNLANLETLDLGNNNISHLNESMLLPLPKIKRFSLSQNHLEVVKPRVFRDLEHVSYIDLSGNPFTCSCDNLGFQDWITRTKIQIIGLYSVNSSAYTCKGPGDSDGIHITEWSPEQFECDRTMLYMIIFGSVGLTLVVAGIVSTIVYRVYKCYKRRKEEKEKRRINDYYYSDDELDGKPKGGKLDLSRMTTEEIAEEITNAIERRERRSMRKAEEMKKKNSNGYVPWPPKGNGKEKNGDKTKHETTSPTEKSDRNTDKQQQKDQRTDAKTYDMLKQPNDDPKRYTDRNAGKKDQEWEARNGEQRFSKDEEAIMRAKALKVHRPPQVLDASRLPPHRGGKGGYAYLEPEPDYGYQTEPSPRRSSAPRRISPNRCDAVDIWDRDARGWVMQGQKRSRSQGRRREDDHYRYLTLPIRDQGHHLSRDRARSSRRREPKMFLDHYTNEVRFGVEDLRRHPPSSRTSRWDAYQQQQHRQRLRSHSLHHLPQDYHLQQDSRVARHDRGERPVTHHYASPTEYSGYRNDDQRPMIGARTASQPYLVSGNTSDWL